MSELIIVCLAATIALALIVAANILRSRFAGPSRPERAAASRTPRFQISPTAFLSSRRARQAFFEQVRVSVGLASGPAYRLSGRGTKTSMNAKGAPDDRIWIVPAPAVRKPFEHMLASNHPYAASGRHKAARLNVDWPMLARVERHAGPVSKLRPTRHAPRHWPVTARASA